MQPPQIREFRPFEAECEKAGISSKKARELSNAGLLDTVKIGRKRFVYVDSLYSLPERIARHAAAGAE